ncbi:hypothetical protein [Arthrobacter cryoconiti]|uniref:Activator of Hsp90 ATPase homolog 1-like protein n=1 Tax=Arthrobacter cryoconiti TaxID=748907 RepID=A0ABV8R172_9MICC|nr:hypothetical protein [Arthrobacter cryoconiti]MCC9069976.1 hypothetical protein [Arthrobacter cryoconiti]
MSNIFSHAPDPDYVPVEASSRGKVIVVLGVSAEHAFDGFTDGVHLWWPVETMSVFGIGAHIAFLEDHLVEESDDGEESVLANVVDWDASSALGLEWTVGSHAFAPLNVEITFEAVESNSCRVSVEFDRVSTDEEQISREFVCDWSLILASYTRFMGGALSLD